MELRPETVWLLDEVTYLFFLTYKGSFASVSIDVSNKQAPPRLQRYRDIYEYHASQHIAEALPGVVELPPENYKIDWDFKDGDLGVRGRILPTNSGKIPGQE